MAGNLQKTKISMTLIKFVKIGECAGGMWKQELYNRGVKTKVLEYQGVTVFIAMTIWTAIVLTSSGTPRLGLRGGLTCL